MTKQKNPTDSFAITLGSDGNYYGTTPDGGTVDVGSEGVAEDPGAGLFYRIVPEAAQDRMYESLAAFDATTGPPPVQILEGSDGVFYGVSVKSSGAGHQPALLKLSPPPKPSPVILREDIFEGETFAGDINGLMFRGPDGAIYLELSRATLDSPDPADLLVRLNQAIPAESSAFTSTGGIKFMMLASTGIVYGSKEQANARGTVTSLSELGFVTLPFNRPPYARPDIVTIPAGATSVTFFPLKNDGDPDRDKLSLTKDDLTQPEHGTADVDSDGRVSYTPDSVSTLSDSFTYTVHDGNGGTATARISVVRAGPSRTYAGEVPIHVMPAYCRATITNTGQLTGVVNALGRRIPLKITLNEDREGEIIRAVTLPVNDNPEEDEQLNLTITLKETLPTSNDSAGSLSVTLETDTNSTTETLAESPRNLELDPQYTVTIPPFDPMAGSGIEPDGTRVQITDVPAVRPGRLGGAGWAAMSVSATGYARLVGKLADGRPISFGGPFSTGSALPIYVTSSPRLQLVPAPPRGFFAGTLNFGGGEGEQTDADCSGIFRWTRPWGEKGIFKLGFAIRQPVGGYRYTRGGGGNNEPVELPAKMELSGPAGLPPVETHGTTKGAVFSFPELDATFKVVGRDGTVTGTLRHPSLGTSSAASGIVIRKLNQLVGFYKTPNGTGRFIIKGD
jgi:hypothetical protein